MWLLSKLAVVVKLDEFYHLFVTGPGFILEEVGLRNIVFSKLLFKSI